jgi:hypothetical protein
MKLLLILFIVLLAFTVGYATWITVHIVRQRRAERALTKQLSGDTAFHEILTRYAEQIYQFGQPSPETTRDLWSYVLECAAGLNPHGYLIAEALTQPSVVDRHRYLGKIVQQALRSMLRIPFAELELGTRDAPPTPEQLAAV